MTAAHCFNAPPDDPFYTVATVRIQDDPEGHIEVSKIIQHPHYNITTVQRDIAVLWLAQDLIFDYVKIRPVRLPKHSSALRNGMEVFVSGGFWLKNHLYTIFFHLIQIQKAQILIFNVDILLLNVYDAKDGGVRVTPKMLEFHTSSNGHHSKLLAISAVKLRILGILMPI